MKALVVYESMFGNTERIAQEIAAGLADHMEVEVREVAEAPRVLSREYDVVVVGCPTHALSMSTKRSRERARRRGARFGSIETGLREWLEALDIRPDAALVATFDTRVNGRHRAPGSAARAAGRSLHRLGSLPFVHPQTFRVVEENGPIYDGEADRARGWGGALAVLSGAAERPRAAAVTSVQLRPNKGKVLSPPTIDARLARLPDQQARRTRVEG